MDQLPPDKKIYVFPIGLNSWGAVCVVKVHNLKLSTQTLDFIDLRRVGELVGKVEEDGVILLTALKDVAEAVDVTQAIANPESVTAEQLNDLQNAQRTCIQLVEQNLTPGDDRPISIAQKALEKARDNSFSIYTSVVELQNAIRNDGKEKS